MEFLAALVGAVVGGALATLVAVYQTRRMLAHDVKLFHDSLAAEREAGRTALRRTAAAEALRAIGSLDAAMPHMDHRSAFIGPNVPAYVRERRERAERAMEDLRRVEVASVPLLGSHLQQGWAELLKLADEASRAGEIGDDAARAAAQTLGRHASELHGSLVELASAD